MRHPVSSSKVSGVGCACVGVPDGVVFGVVLPGPPEDADPGSGEDSDGMGVPAATGSGLAVDGGGPGGGMAGVVGDSAGDGLPEAVIAGPAEHDAAAFAGGVGDRGDAGFGGELVLGGEALAHVAELGEDLGGADAPGAWKGQMRQPIQRLVRGRISRPARDDAGRGGHGIRTIITMAHLTRLDFAIGSAGLMRQALSQAIHHLSHRRAFQRALVNQPIMRNVVADLAVKAEALMWMGLRLAHALDRAGASEAERLLSRIATPVAKYWVCRRSASLALERSRGVGEPEPQPHERLGLDREIGGHVAHDRLVDQRALERVAVRYLADRLAEHLAHQARRTDSEIQAGEVRHPDEGADAVPLLAEHRCVQFLELHLAGEALDQVATLLLQSCAA